jgi:hypothetical protein
MPCRQKGVEVKRAGSSRELKESDGDHLPEGNSEMAKGQNHFELGERQLDQRQRGGGPA